MSFCVNENTLSPLAQRYLRNCKNKMKFVREAIEQYVSRLQSEGEGSIAGKDIIQINNKLDIILYEIRNSRLPLEMNIEKAQSSGNASIQKDKAVHPIVEPIEAQKSPPYNNDIIRESKVNINTDSVVVSEPNNEDEKELMELALSSVVNIVGI